jgi:hypothetical protein
MPITLDKVKHIGQSILEGLTVEEACVLVDVPVFELEEFVDKNPALKNYMEKKRIEFKKKHLEIINDKRDPKNSLWLLERLLPEQFASRRTKQTEDANFLAVFVKEIQNNQQDLVKIHEHKSDHKKADQEILSIEEALS